MSMLSKFFVLKISGVEIGFWELKRYEKEAINLELLTKALVLIKKANLNISKQEIIDSLKENYNTNNIINLLLFAKKHKNEFSFEDAKRGDRIGIDFIKEISSSGNIEHTIRELKQKIYSNT